MKDDFEKWEDRAIENTVKMNDEYIHNLQEIKDPKVATGIIEKTGTLKPDKQGLECPHCGAHEVYADPNEPNNTDKWYWLIKAFSVDDWSFCRNCDGGFRC